MHQALLHKRGREIERSTGVGRDEKVHHETRCMDRGMKVREPGQGERCESVGQLEGIKDNLGLPRKRIKLFSGTEEAVFAANFERALCKQTVLILSGEPSQRGLEFLILFERFDKVDVKGEDVRYLPETVEEQGEYDCKIQGEGWLFLCSAKIPPLCISAKRGKEVDGEARHLVERVEHHAIPPHDNRPQHRTVDEDKGCSEELRTWINQGSSNSHNVGKVAEVEHERAPVNLKVHVGPNAYQDGDEYRVHDLIKSRGRPERV